MTRFQLPILPLTRESFEPFGDVIEIAGSKHHTINQGWAERYHDLAKVDTAANGGRPLINVFRAEPRPMPLRISVMERHPLSSQAFVPLFPRPFLLVVAKPGKPPKPRDLVCFRTVGSQGVNYGRGTWHHPLIALDQSTDFLVIDRGGKGDNCDEIFFNDVEVSVGG